jgi:AcrR family transcriptional regulator
LWRRLIPALSSSTAARHLFAECGFSGTSVRLIADLAGVNLAAVGYQFGSKAELLAAVVRRVVEPIIAAQSAGLDRLLAQTTDPPVTDLMEAFAGPLFADIPAGDAGADRTSRLIVTTIVDPAEEMRGWTGSAEDAVRDRYWRPSSVRCPAFPRRSCCPVCAKSLP